MFSKIYTSSGPVWEKKNTFPFNELILSFNGIRPLKGKWTFWVSLKKNEWLKYAEWGADGQRSFNSKKEHSRCYQDVAIPKELSDYFKVRVEGEELEGLKSLSACLSHLEKYRIEKPKDLESVLLKNVPRQSQMVLDHPRHKDLCSPTSTSIVSNFLLGKNQIDPITFSKWSHDDEFDIYGNWILNVAESYSQTRIPCHVERLNHFSDLHAHLLKGRPVIVSVKGAIQGAPKPYRFGHLMCVIGYEAGKVYCIDPAFSDNESTAVCYDLEDFLKAWSERKNLSYVFLL